MTTDIDDDLRPTEYVRALYKFTSDEPSSLEFSAGAVIRVLNRLGSGWWDGIVDDRRGWFPCNYVTAIKISSQNPYHPPLDRAGYTNGSGMNGDLNISFSGEVLAGQAELDYEDEDQDGEGDDVQKLPCWLPQSTADGRVYFLNSADGVSSWHLPFESLTANGDSDDEGHDQGRGGGAFTLVPDERQLQMNRTKAPAPPLPSPTESQLPTEHPLLSADATTVSKTPPQPLEILPISRDPKDLNQDDTTDVPTPSDTPTETSGKDLGADDNLTPTTPEQARRLPKLQSKTSKRKFFTRNNSFQDSLSQIPARLLQMNDHPSVEALPPGLTYFVKPSDDEGERNMGPFSTAQIYDGALPNPASLVQAVQYAVERLCMAVENKHKVFFGLYSGEIVASIRRLATALPLSNQATLRGYYRQVFACLSKLVLSTKIASHLSNEASLTTPVGYAGKMAADAIELVSAVQAYCQTAVSLKCVPNRINPVFLVPDDGSVSTGGGWTGNIDEQYVRVGISRKMRPPILVIDSIESTARRLQTKLRHFNFGHLPTQQLQDNIRISLHLLLTGDVIDSAAHLLDLAETVDLGLFYQISSKSRANPNTQTPTFLDFLVAKQGLYDCLASLAMASQELSINASIPLVDRFKDVQLASRDLSKAISGLCFSLQILIEESEVKREQIQNDDDEGQTAEYRDLSAAPSIASSENDLPRRAPGKARQIFGEDVLDDFGQTLTPKLRAETPWYLGHDHEEELSFDSNDQVKGGSLIALVEHLTLHDFLDSAFNSTFLLTYGSFTTKEEFFTLLMQRFDLPPPENLSEAEIDVWQNRKIIPIRFRVINILKTFLEIHFQGSPSDPILNEIQYFASSPLAEVLPGAQGLIKLVTKRQVASFDTSSLRKMVPNRFAPTPPTVLPKNLRKLRLLDIDPLETARQLTLMEWRIYSKIKSIECLDKAWSNRDDNTAANIKEMISMSNQVTGWVAESILTLSDIKKRVSTLKHFATIAEKCHSLNNFSMLTAIISGLNSAPVHRLKRTWEMVNARTMQSLNAMNQVMSPTRNFREYREQLHVGNPPCVPFLGVYLTDLTFIEDGNPNMIRNSPFLINFSKRMKTAEVIRDIQQYQSVSYSLQPIPEIQDYFEQCLANSRDVGEMYDLSLNIEPREREDEKIARLLQESGFL